MIIDIFILVGFLVGAVDGDFVHELHVTGQLVWAAAVKQVPLTILLMTHSQFTSDPPFDKNTPIVSLHVDKSDGLRVGL